MRRWFRISAPMLLIPLLLQFQNCSKVQFVAENGGFLKSSNNGGGYGGKPDGDYYRFIPDFTCENRETFAMQVHAANDTYTLTENKRMLCNAMQTNLDPAQIDTSVYQNEIIGYQEGIFEGKAVTPIAIPAQLVEVWCRDSKTQGGYETITYFDRSTNLASTRIYFASQNAGGEYQNQMIPDFSVARTVSNRTVSVRDGKNFELLVNRDQPASQAGLFKGHLNAVIDGQNVDREVSCRLGGSIDVQVWPVQQVVDLNVLYFKTSPDKRFFSYQTDTGATGIGRNTLYLSSIDGIRQKAVNTQLSFSDYNFHFSSDSKKLIYLEGQGDGPLYKILYRYDIGTATNLIQSQDTNSASVYSASGDGQYMFYNAGRAENTWLKSKPMDGGPEIDLNPPLTPEMGLFDPHQPQTHVMDRFAASPIGNEVAFLCCNLKIELYLSAGDGSFLRKITPPVPAGYSLFELRYSTPLSKRWITAYAWTDPMRPPIRYLSFVVRTDGSGSFTPPANSVLTSYSPSEEFGVFISYQNYQDSVLVNLNTGSTFPLPNFQSLDHSPFFTSDSKSYVGVIASGGSATIGGKAIAVSTLDGTNSEICPGVPVQSIQEIAPRSFVLMSHSSGSRTLDVYRTSPLTSECRKVNSVAVSEASVTKVSMKVSNDLQKLVIERQAQRLDGSPEHRLYYVPLDGKPAFQINSPVLPNATISYFDFLNDSKSVIYMGSQITADRNGVYLWSAPP